MNYAFGTVLGVAALSLAKDQIGSRSVKAKQVKHISLSFMDHYAYSVMDLNQYDTDYSFSIYEKKLEGFENEIEKVILYINDVDQEEGEDNVVYLSIHVSFHLKPNLYTDYKQNETSRRKIDDLARRITRYWDLDSVWEWIHEVTPFELTDINTFDNDFPLFTDWVDNSPFSNEDILQLWGEGDRFEQTYSSSEFFIGEQQSIKIYKDGKPLSSFIVESEQIRKR